MGKSKIDCALYLVTDRGLSRGRRNLDIIRAAVAGGVTMVQLREKEATTREFYQEGLKINEFLGEHNIPLIIDNAYGAPFPGIIFADATPFWEPHVILTLSLSKLGLPGELAFLLVKRPYHLAAEAEDLSGPDERQGDLLADVRIG